MSLRVEVSEPAEQDADGIYVWLHNRSPDGAGRLWKAFLAALERLKQNAAGLPLAAEADHFEGDKLNERAITLLFLGLGGKTCADSCFD